MPDSRLSRLSPYVLSLLRIVAALLFLEHGVAKLFGFPAASSMPATFTLHWFAGLIEVVGGALLALGLFSRFAAFIMAGEMAFAYFLGHAPQGFFPLLNRGEGSILFCFVFFYIVFAGPGPVSLDTLVWRDGQQMARRARRSKAGANEGHSVVL